MDARAIRALVDWFAAGARDLPWRLAIGAPRDPYAVLVSESMLQQTQVSRVIERFPLFMQRFPTVRALAAADERDVLAMWSGLGYYRRARNLHAAARIIVDRFGGEVPRESDSLRELPGVGRYTAGAIASLAFGIAAPIVDGNVARVLLRIHGREVRSDDRAIQPWLWEHAKTIARLGAESRSAGAANEAMMELGATVCLASPATPRCDSCPLAPWCSARKDRSYGRIPLPKAAAKKSTIYCAAAVIRDRRGRILLEQRGHDGMWAGMWQAPTIEREDRPPARAELARAAGLKAQSLSLRGGFTHTTTHRTLEFTVYCAAWTSRTPPRRGEWCTTDGLSARGISSAQQRILRTVSDTATRATASATVTARRTPRPRTQPSRARISV